MKPRAGRRQTGRPKMTSKKTGKVTSASLSSSRKPQPDVQRVLMDIDRAVRRLGASWFLFGARAVGIHGAPRTTKDVDVTVLLGERSTDELVASLKEAGFELLHDDEAFVATTRVIPTRHRETRMKTDVVLGGPGLEQHIADQAVHLRLAGRLLPVIRLEHLIVLKCLAARPQDIEDLRRLLRRRADVDLDEVRRLISTLESDLGDSTIMPNLDRLLAELGR